MKKILVTILVVLSIPAMAYAPGFGIDTDNSWRINQKFFKGDTEIYSVIDAYGLNIVPVLSGYIWAPDKIGYSDVKETNLDVAGSFGICFNWSHVYFRTNRYFSHLRDSTKPIWCIDSFWLEDTCYNYSLKYLNTDIADTGAGFSAEVCLDPKTKSTFTELMVEYRFEYQEAAVRFYGKQKTWFMSEGGWMINGRPFCDIYTVGVEFMAMGLSVYFEHFCAHDVLSKESMDNDPKYGFGCEETGYESPTNDVIGLRYHFN